MNSRPPKTPEIDAALERLARLVPDMGDRIEHAARYIFERMNTPETRRTADDPTPQNEDKGYLDPRKVTARIRTAKKHVVAALEALGKLRTDFDFGRLDPYHETQRYIEAADNLLGQTLAPLSDALVMAHDPRWAAFDLDKAEESAARLAHAIVGPLGPKLSKRYGLPVALAIMGRVDALLDDANTDPTHPKKMSRKLAEVRDEDQKDN